MPLIYFHTCKFHESQSFAKNTKVKYLCTSLDVRYIYVAIAQFIAIMW